MKAKLFVIGLFLFAHAACVQKAKAPEPVEGPTHNNTPSQALQSIDTQMWRRPDSALMRLLPWFDTCCRDAARHVSTASAYNRHYANLLLSELLYKNDYPQTNRTELQQAVNYFDSLCLCKDVARNVSTIAFLDARAHYINGVGYYENDSAVEACKEYLTALEIVDIQFPDEKIQEYASLCLAHLPYFMSLIYGRLGELFSEQFMIEPSIVCYKNAFHYCKEKPSSPYIVANALYRIGIQYDSSGEKDSANYYYDKAFDALPETTNLLYRDIVSSQTLLKYQLNQEKLPAMQQFKKIVALAKDEDERLTRYATIGYVFYEENQYDSAILYLEPVYEHKTNDPIRIQVAEYLCAIYDSIGCPEMADVYIRFLAKNKPIVADEEAKVSQLNTLFKDYLNKKQERDFMKEKVYEQKMTIKRTTIILVLFLLTIVLLFFALRKRYKKHLLEKEETAKQQLEEEKRKHQEVLLQQQTEAKIRLDEKNRLLTANETKTKAIEQQLERINAAMKTPKQRRTESEQRRKAFLCEPICCSIITSVSDLHLSARSQYGDFYQFAINETDSIKFGNAVAKHFPNFVSHLAMMSPKLNWKEVQTCYLYLLNLEDTQIAVLQQCHNSTIHRRKARLQNAFNTTKPFPDFIRNLAYSQG